MVVGLRKEAAAKCWNGSHVALRSSDRETPTNRLIGKVKDAIQLEMKK